MHVTTIHNETQSTKTFESKVATFHGKDVKLQLDVVLDSLDGGPQSSITFSKKQKHGMLGEGLAARVEIMAGETISFILRDDKTKHVADTITTMILDGQQHDTLSFWYSFIAQLKYKGRWMEVVSRSLMILKMMTFGGCLLCGCYSFY